MTTVTDGIASVYGGINFCRIAERAGIFTVNLVPGANCDVVASGYGVIHAKGYALVSLSFYSFSIVVNFANNRAFAKCYGFFAVGLGLRFNKGFCIIISSSGICGK